MSDSESHSYYINVMSLTRNVRLAELTDYRWSLVLRLYASRLPMYM